ncbi:VOC family protein [Microbacterium sp. SD291]|uniref:VOC family protein n=1 Tax=Microbacterium sp. SD291 TaxID=2782007 RepID=UPI001A965259|nr:VOC family protein [Microbacterium sp. SD291]MBO0979345.1 VOC family protein [Microbacterium sp. SD291]
MRGLHHVEVWVADLHAATESWGWLLAALGFECAGEWPDGRTWDAGGAYVTLTTSPNLSASEHDRRRPGVNHLAFRGGSPEEVDAVMSAAGAQGWRPLYHDRYPHAGGPGHYAGWLENDTGFKVEIVAEPG